MSVTPLLLSYRTEGTSNARTFSPVTVIRCGSWPAGLLPGAPALAAPGAIVSGPTSAVTYQIGISHGGYSGDTTIVAPLSRRWSRTFTGPVSYPIVADHRVLVTVADSGSSGTNLYALNQVTGAIIWSRPISGTTFWSGAAYDSGRVFVVNFDGLLRAFNAFTGRRQWSTYLPGQFAFSSPPTASRGIVYTGGAGLGGTVYAVSEKTGSVLWTQRVLLPGAAGPPVSCRTR